MACFIVPATEAVVTTVVRRIVKKKEKDSPEKENGIRLSEKLGWLNGMLWGGSGLLAFEHIWHGELTPVFPFLTNAAEPAQMLHEMAAAGTAMSALVTAVWLGAVLVTHRITSRQSAEKDVLEVNV